jgi:hypothetical protein
MNVKLEYMYRDAGNYKRHGEVVFSNKNDIPISTVKDIILNNLIEGEWFQPTLWNLPDLHFDDWDDELDVPYHEFICIEETTEQAASYDVQLLIEVIDNSKK